jgi:replicative DNA helicase
MSADELTDRVAAASAGVNLSHLTNRTLSEEETGALRRRLAIIRDWPLDLDDHVTTIADIRRGARNAPAATAACAW